MSRDELIKKMAEAAGITQKAVKKHKLCKRRRMRWLYLLRNF
jgi:hypothetical protein